MSTAGTDENPPRLLFMLSLVAINTCSSIDRVAIITIGPAIKQDLRLTDFQFGLIAGFGFALFYAFLGLPIARLADTCNRVKLIGWAIAIWSLFLMLSGQVRSFLQLMACRIAVGIGEAGVQPPSVSLVSDLYPPERRGFALGLLSLGVPIGTLAGAIGAGYLTQTLSWRTTFLLIGLPGIVLAALVWTFLSDRPGAAGKDIRKEARTAPSLAALSRDLGRRPSFWQLLAGIALTNVVVNGLGAFLPQYFARVSQLSLGRVGVIYGSIGAGATLVGYFFGGAAVDWISRRDSRWYVWISAIGCVASVPLYVSSFMVAQPVVATALLALASVCIFLYYTPTQVVLQNMAQPQTRATVAFVFFLVVGLVGVGFGPVLVGWASDWFASRLFSVGDYQQMCVRAITPAPMTAHCAAASAAGLQYSMIAMAAVGVWAALHFLLAARTLRRDIVGPGVDGARAQAVR